MTRTRTLTERFWSNVEKHPGGCWRWKGRQMTIGYGYISKRGPDGKHWKHVKGGK